MLAARVAASPQPPTSRFTVVGDPTNPSAPMVGFLVATLTDVLLWSLLAALLLTLRPGT